MFPLKRASKFTNYPSEISALAHRIVEPHLKHDLIVQALTNESFFKRSDVVEGASGAQPSREEKVTLTDTNNKLVVKGQSTAERLTLSFVRQHWPLAPEEFICTIVAHHLLSDNALIELAESLGLQHLVRTIEFPPTGETLINALYALVGTLDTPNAQNFLIRFVLPGLVDIDLEDVLPFRYPFPIVCEYLRVWQNCEDVEARQLFATGIESAMPMYIAGIYANKELIGESPGEKLCIAVDLAAQDALLKLWQISNTTEVFPFNDTEEYKSTLNNFDKHNHSIREICAQDIDLSILTPEELRQEPLSVTEVAEQYVDKVYSKIGLPHRKRLHHMFSRGTIAKKTSRVLVRPLPHNI